MLGGGLEFPAFLATYARGGIERAWLVSPVADIHPYKLLYRAGHLTACLVLLLVVAGGYAWALRRGPVLGRGAGRLRAGVADGLRWTLPAGVATLILGLINPYYIVLLAGLLGLHSLWLLAARRSARGLLAALGPAAGCALASLQYAVQRITANLGAIAMDDPVGPGHFALFFAVILPLAAAGWWWARSPGGAGEAGPTGPGGLGDPGGLGGPALRDPDSLLAVWLVFGVLAVLSPVPFRVRLLLGLWVALAIPAAPLLARWGLRTPVPYLVLALLWVDVWYNFRKEARDVETGRVLIATAALDAFGWLEANAPPDSVVLAHALAANPIPAYAGVRVLIGHSFQTAGYYELHERVLEFYRAMPPGRQREFLDAHGVDYVLVGPLERPLLGTRPAAFPGMTRLYSARGYEIWGEGE
jgi:hypothetical protein